MHNTYQNLLPLSSPTVTDGDCIVNYQENQNPIYLSTVFIRHFPMILQLANNYWGLSMEDKASFCLEEVHRALLGFSSEHSTKFSTFLFSYVKNRLRTETQSLSTDKRRSIYFTNDEGDQELFFGLSDSKEITEEPELLLSIADSALTENEKAYCAYVIRNNIYATASDFAKQQNISSAAVHYIREALQLKIGSVLV